MKRCTTSLIIGEMQVKTTVRHHVVPVRMAIIRKHKMTCVGEDVEGFTRPFPSPGFGVRQLPEQGAVG